MSSAPYSILLARVGCYEKLSVQTVVFQMKFYVAEKGTVIFFYKSVADTEQKLLLQ